MKYNKFILVLSMIFLISISISLAEDLPFEGYSCEIDEDCWCPIEEGCLGWSELLLSTGAIEEIYPLCNATTGTCYSLEQPAVEVNTTTVTNVTTVASPALNSQVSELKANIAKLTTRINSLENSESTFEQQLVGLNSELQSLNGNLQGIEQVQGELNAVAVGLAGLQQEVETTTADLEKVEADLNQKSTRNKVIGFIFLVLLALSAFVFLGYYIVGKKKPFGKVDPKIVSYITTYIKQGLKYPHIKTKLMASGWSEDAIKWAYKETIKNNYKTYKNKKVSTKAPSTWDKNKIITITVVSVLLVVGVLFVLNGSVGQAISLQKFFSENGEITYGVECTSPHVLNPDQDGCCLDFDNTGSCDYIEAQEQSVEAVASGNSCTDSFQCQQNEYCIDSSCQTLASQYQGIGDCSKQCNTYAAWIKTNDEESYPVQPGEGSYTSAGAVEWKLLEGPTHCKGEPAFVPIRVTRKNLNGIINQEHFALRQGETSKVITHPEVDSVSFTIYVDKIFEHCPQ